MTEAFVVWTNDRAGEASSRLRWAYRVTVLVAVVPIAVAAIRDGLQGWQPTWDAATTAVRIRDVFSGHPPLYGLVAAPSSSVDRYSYIGAIEFYLLAVPVKLFGTTWGLLLGTATINAVALIAALWLIRRRVGYRSGLVATAIVASLVWSLGSEFLVDATPIQIVTLPFFTLLAAAWSVADDDGPALLVLAVVGNFLLLTHFAMAIAAPLIGAVALVLWIFTLRRHRRDSPETWRDHRQSRLRWLALCLVATLLLWVPPLYEQATAGDGNISLVIESFLHGPGSTVSGTWTGAIGVVTSVLAVPPWWLPPNFVQAPFDVVGGGQSMLVRLLFGSLLVGVMAFVFRSARGRLDLTINRGLVIGIAGIVAWTITWRVNPAADNSPAHYFWGLWPLAAYLWFIVSIGTYRALRSASPRLDPEFRRIAVPMLGILVLASAVLALGQRRNCPGMCASSIERLVAPAGDIRTATATFAREHQGPIGVDTSPGESSVFLPAMLLGLQDVGVEARVTGPFSVRQFGAARSATAHPGARSELFVTNGSSAPRPGRIVGVFRAEPTMSASAYADLDRRMRHWAERSHDLLSIAQHQVELAGNQRVYAFAASIFVTEQTNDTDLVPFAEFITALDNVGLSPGGGALDIAGSTPADVRAWAVETARRASGTYWMYAVEPR